MNREVGVACASHGWMMCALRVLCICLCALVTNACKESTAQNATLAFNDGKEYLTPELREKVENLKRESAKAPTTSENVGARMRIVWDWANAYAVAGGLIPDDLPMMTALGFATPAKFMPPEFDLRVFADQYIETLSLYERMPNAIGKLESAPHTPLEMNSYHTITLIYTVGDAPIEVGGGFMLGSERVTDQGEPQMTDPAAPNYTTVKSSNGTAHFVLDKVLNFGVHGGFGTAMWRPFLRLEGPTLRKGDTVTITYGDTSGGSPGFKTQTYSNDHAPLPLYLRLAEKGALHMLPIQGFEIVGGPAVALNGVAPSLVRPGEKFNLRLRADDIYRNRATGEIPAYDILLNGKPFKSVGPSQSALSTISNLSFSKPGVYRFAFKGKDGKILGRANPLLVDTSMKNKIYWGDMHGHSGFAEAQGTPDGYFKFAREDAVLDFITHTEHDLFMDDHEWSVLVKNAKKYNKDNDFVVFLGYEWTQTIAWGGHHNVFFRTPENRTLVRVHNAPHLSDLYHGLRQNNQANDVLIIPHAHEPGDWRQSEPNMERLVETVSDHGTFGWFAQNYLNAGYQIGIIGSSDDHTGHPGYNSPRTDHHRQIGGLAAVRASEKTSQTLFNELRARHTYATSGERIILDFSLNDTPMGERAAFSPDRHLKGRVVGTAPIEEVAILRNGETVWQKTFGFKPNIANCSAYLVQFETSSTPPFKNLDVPRAWRPWRGNLTLHGARIAGFSSRESFINARLDVLKKDAEKENSLRFATSTRGNRRSILVDVAGREPGAAMEITLEAGKDEGPTPASIKRPLHETKTFKIALEETSKEPIRIDIPAKPYNDTITVSCHAADEPLDYAFTFNDTNVFSPGDYYYLTVRQANGHMAWSSPVWVGGSAPN